VPVLGAAQVPQVDILLSILACEIDVMQGFAKIGGHVMLVWLLATSIPHK
jgi:hypothetical protein